MLTLPTKLTLISLLAAIGTQAAPSLVGRQSVGPLFAQDSTESSYNHVATHFGDQNFESALRLLAYYKTYLKSLVEFEGDVKVVEKAKVTVFDIETLAPSKQEISQSDSSQKNNLASNIWWPFAFYKAPDLAGLVKSAKEGDFEMPDMKIDDAMKLLSGRTPSSYNPGNEEDLKKIIEVGDNNNLKTRKLCQTKVDATKLKKGTTYYVWEYKDDTKSVTLRAGDAPKETQLLDDFKADCHTCWFWEESVLSTSTVYDPNSASGSTASDSATASSTSATGSSTESSAIGSSTGSSASSTGSATSTGASGSDASSVASETSTDAKSSITGLSTASESQGSSTSAGSSVSTGAQSPITGSDASSGSHGSATSAQSSLSTGQPSSLTGSNTASESQGSATSAQSSHSSGSPSDATTKPTGWPGQVSTVTVTTTEKPVQSGLPDEPVKPFVRLTTEVVTVKPSGGVTNNTSGSGSGSDSSSATGSSTSAGSSTGSSTASASSTASGSASDAISASSTGSSTSSATASATESATKSLIVSVTDKGSATTGVSG